MRGSLRIELLIALLLLILGIGVAVMRSLPGAAITSFDACVEAGYPVLESYPPQCKTQSGASFTQDIGNEFERMNEIRIASPRPQTSIESPFIITGEARGTWYFEASFPIKLLDAEGREMGITVAQAESDWMTEEFVPFRATLTFDAPETATGTLLLMRDNPSGLPEYDRELVVPVRFSPAKAGEAETMTVKVFWGDSNDTNPETQCRGVVSFSRSVPKTEGVARAALNELIKGPTREERGEGYFSSLPQNAGVAIQSLRIENGTAYVDFNDRLEYQMGGSCRVSHVRSQIESTLKQFPTVKNVIISINGRIENILQP